MKPSSRQRRRKVSITVYVTPQQAKKLRTLSARTQVPVAAYIRQGIDLMLKKVGA
ncbi:MAG: ribbon-helix-helix domain-containing protein [Proteobacteria bacterium]|nr:ribbon-helix-helix domain-containing protein [Pseudomonadota bacterium]